MKITFLGTGSSIPSPKVKGKPFRSYASILVEIGKEKLLFDLGPGTLTKLQQSGIDTRVYPSCVFISHYHLDHCQDYPALVKGRVLNIKFGTKVKSSSLNVYGPKGLKEFSDALFKNNQKWDYMANELQAYEFTHLNEVKNGLIVETKNWKVSCIPIKHYNGVAYRLEAESKVFVYSGDMAYDENLADLGQGADLAAVECSFPDRESLQGLHLCPEDIGKLAKLGNFKKTVLTHLYPPCEGREEEMIKVVESLSQTKALVAHDFLEIIV